MAGCSLKSLKTSDFQEKFYLQPFAKLHQPDAEIKKEKTDLAYMAGARDAILMLRYLDVIRDR